MLMVDSTFTVCRGKMKKIVTFGEIMLRLSPPNQLRFGQARTLDATYGGGESNVAVSVANYGLEVEFVTCLPKNDIGEACLQYLRQYRVGTRYIQRGGNRLGIYFLENGSVMRGSQVIYDRADSSFATITPNMFDWKTIFSEADWFHWTGIAPAVSEGAAAVCLEAVKTAREMGITISCGNGENLPRKLWKNWFLIRT
jgi:2-dehydro-3-deoxygluconokinase